MRDLYRRPQPMKEYYSGQAKIRKTRRGCTLNLTGLALLVATSFGVRECTENRCMQQMDELKTNYELVIDSLEENNDYRNTEVRENAQ